MWRLWDVDSQEEQGHSYNKASDGIPILASDSDESVIFFAEWPSPSVQGPGIIMMANTHDLPTFSSSDSGTSLSFGKSLLSNIFYL